MCVYTLYSVWLSLVRSLSWHTSFPSYEAKLSLFSQRGKTASSLQRLICLPHLSNHAAPSCSYQTRNIIQTKGHQKSLFVPQWPRWGPGCPWNSLANILTTKMADPPSCFFICRWWFISDSTTLLTQKDNFRNGMNLAPPLWTLLWVDKLTRGK